jgi:hypothetical protein
MTTGAAIRASDADRERVVEILREQTAQGRLTLEELEERTEAAFTATTWQELSTLTQDLPVEARFERAERRPGDHSPAAGRLPERAGDEPVPARGSAWRALLPCCCYRPSRAGDR